VGYLFLDSNSDFWLQKGSDAVLHMTRGDDVWVEVQEVTGPHTLGGDYSGGRLHTYITGFLIQQDV
jgi:hypothetical protein